MNEKHQANHFTVHFFNTAEAFLARCGHALSNREEQSGLMWSIALKLRENPAYFGTQPYLACIEAAQDLVLVALMTPPYNLHLLLLRPDAQESVYLLAKEIYAQGNSIPGVLAEATTAQAFSTCWCERTGRHFQITRNLRIYALHDIQTVAVDASNGSFRPATIDDYPLALAWFEAFHRDCFPNEKAHEDLSKRVKELLEKNYLYFWQTDRPVSMASFTRSTQNGIAISYVYTPKKERGKGYASRVVASLSRCGLEQGKRFCTLYTDLSNPTSNHLYQRIGYFPVADVADIKFF